MDDKILGEIKDFAIDVSQKSEKISPDILEEVSGGKGVLTKGAENLVDNINGQFFDGNNTFINNNKGNLTDAILVGGGALLVADVAFTVWRAKKIKNWWNNRKKS